MQIKNSFDSKTIQKIAKGALIAGGGAAALYVLQAISGMDFGNATAVITAICSILINAIKEWQAGN